MTTSTKLSDRAHRLLENLTPWTTLPRIANEARAILDEDEARTNLDDALDIVAEIDRVRSVIRELRAAFAKSELDGGVKAAPRHPLYIEAQAKLDQLHDELMMVI